MTKSRLILGLIVATAVIGGIFVWVQKDSVRNEDQSIVNTEEHAGPTEEVVEEQQEEAANIPATSEQPAKPTLSKSSGNAPGSSVPAGALIEFTCEGQINLDCEVVLTNTSDPGNVIRLGKMKISDNGVGQYFASWEWEAVSGEWSVKAVVANGQGQSTESDGQELRVR